MLVGQTWVRTVQEGDVQQGYDSYQWINYGIGRIQQRAWQDMIKLYCTGHCHGSSNKPQKEDSIA